MSLLGKILAILNLLGAIGLTYLMSQDYAKRKSWQQAVFRGDLLIAGLPVSDQDSDRQGRPLTDDLTADLLRDVFKNAGQPVKTQMAEVKRVKDDLDGKVRAAGNPHNEAVELARLLLPFATSNLQRESLTALRDKGTGADDAKKQAELKTEYEDLFRQAQDEKQPKNEQRAAIAHALFNLVEVLPAEGAPAAAADPLGGEAYRRVIAVVGLESLVSEINRQAMIVARVEEELKQELARDRTSFALVHDQLVSQAQDLAETVNVARAEIERAHQQVGSQEKLVNKRKIDVAAATDELAAARKVTAERFKELVAMRNALFNIRVEVREATAENQKRTRKIAELEERAAASH